VSRSVNMARYASRSSDRKWWKPNLAATKTRMSPLYVRFGACLTLTLPAYVAMQVTVG